MLKSPTRKLLSYGALLSFMTPSFALAQTPLKPSSSKNTVTIIDNATANPDFALELSNDLAQCHGFLYALHYTLTKKIEMSIDTIKLEAEIAANAQAAGYAAVLVKLFHSENVGQAHEYANIISDGERTLWKSKFDTSKENFAAISKERIFECNEHKAVVGALLPEAYTSQK